MQARYRKIAEAGLLTALAAVLNLVSIAKLPYAGKLSLEMLPIFLLSFRQGPKIGVIGGACLGMIILFLDPYVVHPVQFILDYPLPHILVGLSGFFRKNIYLGIIIGGLGRFASHFLSGIIFFAAFTPPGTPVWLYSALYNGSYILPQIIVSLIFVPLIIKRLNIKSAIHSK